jgi:hypothetical protein
MKRLAFGALAITVIATIGCSDTTGVSVEDLTGTWLATQFTFTNPANAAESFDLIAAGGTLSLTVDATGDYTATFVEPGSAPDVTTGTISVEGDIVTISESGQGSPTPYAASRSGDTLTLTTDEEEYDFDDDGTDDLASLRIVFSRQ